MEIVTLIIATLALVISVFLLSQWYVLIRLRELVMRDPNDQHHLQEPPTNLPNTRVKVEPTGEVLPASDELDESQLTSVEESEYEAEVRATRQGKRRWQ